MSSVIMRYYLEMEENVIGEGILLGKYCNVENWNGDPSIGPIKALSKLHLFGWTFKLLINPWFEQYLLQIKDYLVR